MPKAQLNDFSMNFEVYPDCLPEDTLFIHGNLGSNNWWNPSRSVWIEQAKPEFKGSMILAEWRGCGESQAPNQESSLHPRALANDYIALLESLNISKVHLVGHSTGGVIALMMMLAKPELIHRAVLLDSVSAEGIEFHEDMLTAFKNMQQDRDFCAGIMGMTIANHDHHRELFEPLVDDAFKMAEPNWEGVLRVLKDFNIRSELKEIINPTLILHGTNDQIVPIEGSKILHSEIPAAQFKELDDQGHSCNVENPKRFVQEVNQFLYQS